MNIRFPSLSKVGAQLLAIIFAIAMPLASAMGYLWLKAVDESRASATEALRAAAVHVAGDLRGLLRKSEWMLSQLAQQSAIREFRAGACEAEASWLRRMHPEFLNVLVWNADGHLACSAVPAQPGFGRMTREHDLFWKRMIASSLHVSDLFYGRIAGQYIIVLSRRILDVQDKPVGVVAVALKPQYIEDVLSGLHLPPGSYAAILDRQNVFVSRVPEGDKWIGKSASAFPINEVPSALERSAADFVGNDGVQRLYVSYTLPEAGWKIYTGTPSEVLMSRHRQWAFWAIALTLALAIVSGFIAYTIASRLAREFNRMLAAEQQLSTRLLRAEEVERRRISLELHDQVGQELTALAMDLKLLRPETAPSTVNRSLAAVDRLIDSVRDVTLTLRPPQLDDLGLLAALRSHVAHYVQPRGIAVHLDFDGVRVARLSSDLEAACFRIVQEALTNVLRHAEARNVWISLRHRGDELVLRLRDDGRGFDYAATLSALGEGRSLGLRNLLDRAQLVGGRLAIRSVPGSGTELEGKFPL